MAQYEKAIDMSHHVFESQLNILTGNGIIKQESAAIFRDFINSKEIKKEKSDTGIIVKSTVSDKQVQLWEMTLDEFKNSKIRQIKYKPIRWNKFNEKYFTEDYEIIYNLNKDNETYTLTDKRSMYGKSKEQFSQYIEK